MREIEREQYKWEKISEQENEKRKTRGGRGRWNDNHGKGLWYGKNKKENEDLGIRGGIKKIKRKWRLR